MCTNGARNINQFTYGPRAVCTTICVIVRILSKEFLSVNMAGLLHNGIITPSTRGGLDSGQNNRSRAQYSSGILCLPKSLIPFSSTERKTAADTGPCFLLPRRRNPLLGTTTHTHRQPWLHFSHQARPSNKPGLFLQSARLYRKSPLQTDSSPGGGWLCCFLRPPPSRQSRHGGKSYPKSLSTKCSVLVR